MAVQNRCDFLIVGAGVAGLRAALALAPHGDVLVVTKEAVRESNTHYAQGGIAVAMEGQEDVALHLEDTVAAGDGLVHRAAAELLVREGPLRVAELIEAGAHFDRQNGHLMRTREAAHSRPRILHANGDATGAEISRSLAAMARSQTSICFAEWTTVTSLIENGGTVLGATLLDSHHRQRVVSARSVLIASGGAGQVYMDTTNPAVATGDGIALASRAGAELADMEFYQFHPTALFLPGVPRFLLSEALRGEGALLCNDRGERFMERYHNALELAPRDVVARAVARESQGEVPGESRPVYLDMRHVSGVDLHERFPGISAFLAQHGLDLHRDLIPIRPAAHYLMGGIRTDLDGRTSVAGLYAAGEAACTGLHGANRLASNSLLEGLVFGARAAQSMLADDLPSESLEVAAPALDAVSDAAVEPLITRLQHSMGHFAGVLRDETGLKEGLGMQQEIETLLQEMGAHHGPSRRRLEAMSLSVVARAILRSALARAESRGAHFRTDFPRRDDALFQQHSIDRGDGPISFESR
ncbi:L-aspartate oxidase [Acidobacteria bacterium AB60]|nr:L-aspartate oxidase [Acidobacteria bacterium AB60]